MFYDTLYRHNQALSPAGLDHLPAALHALNAAVDDCQRAGKPVASDAATLLLIRHLADVAERDAPSAAALRRRCEADRLAVDAAPALLDIAGKSVGGNYRAKRTFHYQARRALTRLATAIGLDADDTRINTIMGADHEDGTTELRHADLALRVVPRGFLPDSEVSISRCRDGQEIGSPTARRLPNYSTWPRSSTDLPASPATSARCVSRLPPEPRNRRRYLMGWLFMRDMGGYATPRSYLDNQFTYAHADHRLTVLASSMVGSTYYAACERIEASGGRAVFAVVCLTRQSTGAHDGCTFGYKDMTETMGPCESDCPAAILDELTETDSTYASEWRSRCRANLFRRKLERAKPVPKPGQTIVFDEPIRFNDGEDRNRFTVIANPKGKAPLFRDPITGAVCRIAKFRTRAYRLINPAIVPKDTTDG